MGRTQKFVGGIVFVMLVTASTAPASAATNDPQPGYPFQACIETTFAQIRDFSMKVGRFATRTGIEIGRQSKHLGETFRDSGKEIWGAATKDDDR